MNLLAQGRTPARNAGSIEHIVPEFVPWHGSNQPVADLAIELLGNPQKLQAQQQKLIALVESLDKPGGVGDGRRGRSFA